MVRCSFLIISFPLHSSAVAIEKKPERFRVIAVARWKLFHSAKEKNTPKNGEKKKTIRRIFYSFMGTTFLSVCAIHWIMIA